MTELLSANVNIRVPQATLVWNVSGDLPDDGHWTLSTTFTGEDGESIDQLALKVVDGVQVGTWLLRHGDSSTQLNYQIRPHRAKNRWTVVFPAASLRSAHGTWQAALDVNGMDRGTDTGTY
ncbi:MAG: hypothetical protein WA892_05895 [Ornithinimicrobium sp.]